MAVNFRIADGPMAAPWLSPDIDPGQATANGGFTIVNQMTTGTAYDFRVRVHNDGTDAAVPWTESTATGALVGPLAGTGGLAWPLTGAARTIVNAPAGGTRVELVPDGSLPASSYSLELQSAAGATIRVLESTIGTNNPDRRIGVTYSPNGNIVVLLDFNLGSKTAQVNLFAAQASPGLAAGTQLMGSGTVPSFSAFLINLAFVGAWNQTEFVGLNFAFAPEQRSLLLTWSLSTGDTEYAVLDLRAKPRYPNRVSIQNLSRQPAGIGRHLFSPAGDVFALIPSQTGETVELFELPSGQPMTITTNGYPSGPLTLTALNGQLTVNNATSYGGIGLSGISTNSSLLTTVDPPFRSRCAVQVHLWIATPAGVATETGPGNVKLPASVNKQGASAYIARLNGGSATESVIVSHYVAPAMVNAADHRCALAEAYSVTDAQPFQGKQRAGATFLPLTYGQVAQRNLIIVAPNSPWFLVPYALTNDGAKPVDVEVDLEEIDWRDLPRMRSLHRRERVGRVEVTGVGFTDWPCGLLVSRDEVEVTPNLRTQLAPGERRVVAILIDVATEPDPRELDVAVFHVRESRSDGAEGGITVIAASNPDLIDDVVVAEPPTACPIELTGNPVWSATAAEGSASQRFVPPYSEGFLVAEVANTSAGPVDDLDLWLESHAIPDARVEPLVFEAVHLDPGATIRVAWPIELATPAPARYPISLVASSPAHTPHRLLTDILAGPHRRHRDDEPR